MTRVLIIKVTNDRLHGYLGHGYKYEGHFIKDSKHTKTCIPSRNALEFAKQQIK